MSGNEQRYARAGGVAKFFGVSTATVWRWAALPDFPKPFRPSPGSTLFDLGAVKTWLESKREAA